MAKNKRDKTTGLPLPDPVVPLTSVCFQISVPNALEYRSALKGALSALGQAWTWSQTVGQDNQDAFTAAELWRERIANSMYLIDCEATVDCNDVANCINTNAAVQRAIGNVAGTTATPGTTSTPGQHMTVAQSSAPLNPLEGCNLDELWAQCEQLVDYVIQAALDMMEQIEVWTNGVEAVQFVEMIPILGTLFDEAQLDKVVAFIDWIPEVAAEILAAADTPETRLAIKCAIFCRCKVDCVISIDRLWEVENDRLGGVLDPSSIITTEQLIETIVTLGTNPALPLDVWFTFTIAMAKLAGYLGVRGIDFSLTLLLKLAVNDANNDWELLCIDCGTPTNCFTPNYESYHGYGTLIETTEEYMLYEPVNSPIGYAVEAGDLSRSHFCNMDGYEIVTGTFTPTGGFPQGFLGFSTGGVNVTDRSQVDYPICLYSYLSSTPYTIKIFTS